MRRARLLLVRGAERRWLAAAARAGRLAALAILALSPRAFGYAQAGHPKITPPLFSPGQGAPLTPPTQADLDAFRALFWKTASIDAEFAKRYPSEQSFGAWEFKEFCMLDPAARVHGFDLTPDDARPMTRNDLLSAA